VELDLVKQLAGRGGGVAVCVVLVVLFLRHVTSLNETHLTSMKAMSETFSLEHSQTRDAFQQQITALTGKVFEVAEKTTVALFELKSAIIDLQSKMR
jgi:hypothetical protein